MFCGRRGPQNSGNKRNSHQALDIIMFVQGVRRERKHGNFRHSVWIQRDVGQALLATQVHFGLSHHKLFALIRNYFLRCPVALAKLRHDSLFT